MRHYNPLVLQVNIIETTLKAISHSGGSQVAGDLPEPSSLFNDHRFEKAAIEIKNSQY